MSGDLASVRSILSSLPDAVAVASTINHIGSGGSNTLLFKVCIPPHFSPDLGTVDVVGCAYYVPTM